MSQTIQINGYVRDASSGDMLPNAHIRTGAAQRGITSNQYGFFSFAADGLSTEIRVSYTGYQTLHLSLSLMSDTTLVINLVSDNQIGEVHVIGKHAPSTTTSELGSFKLTGHELERIPTLLGEKDIVKALQMMPGIKMGREGMSGLHVRGGSPGQNLMLLDGVPVYNVNHLFGFFSVFTPEAVKSADVYKGAFPAYYGGRISSVIDIKMREGNLYTPKADVSIGTLSTKMVLETPIKKGKSSVLLAARLCNFDLFLNPFTSNQAYNNGNTTETTAYRFYDLNTKYFHDLGDWGRLYWSAYIGNDMLTTKAKTKSQPASTMVSESSETGNTATRFQWGNTTTSVRWNKGLGRKIFVNATLHYSKYRFVQELDEHLFRITTRRDTIISNLKYSQLSQVTDHGLYADFDYYHSSAHHLAFGLRYTHHTFTPNTKAVDISENSGFTFHQANTYSVAANELNAYVEDKLVLSGKWKSVIGLHYSLFSLGGNQYSSFQPRVRTSYDFGLWALKASGGYMVQPVHSLVNSSNNREATIWVPSEAHIRPSFSLQFDLGAAWQVLPSFSLNLEGYWRKMGNILVYGSREQFFGLYEKWYDRVLTGSGEAYGIEAMAAKTAGRTTGRLGYTWSVSNSQFDGLNQGRPFPSAFDRRHYLTVMVNHRYSGRIEFSGNWVYGSGEPVSLSITSYPGLSNFGIRPQPANTGSLFDKQIISPNQLIYYASVNNWRLPAYHRLDLSVSFKKEKKHGRRRTWAFGVYNAYGRSNPYMVSFDTNDEGAMILKNTTIFRFLPSINYRYEF